MAPPGPHRRSPRLPPRRAAATPRAKPPARAAPRVVSPRTFVAASACLAALAPGAARAEPWFDAKDAALEEQFADGDLDEEDVAAVRMRDTVGKSDVHDETWVSVMAFERSLLSGRNDIGAVLVLGLAFDRGGQGRVRRISDDAAPGEARGGDDARTAEGGATADRAAKSATALPALARRCVAAAWRASGLGGDDARLDAIAARSRSSALLPEARLRAMRLWDDAAHATTVATTADTAYYDAVGANLVLEVRLTWRLDRLLYAGDEANLERLRLERQDARARLAQRTLEVLFAWEHDRVESGRAAPGSREQLEAEIRAAEAEATLDVLTAGWFSARDPP